MYRRIPFVVVLALALLLLPAAECWGSAKGDPGPEEKKEDVFKGVFSEKQVHLKPGQVKTLSFTITPTEDVADARVQFTLPANLVQLVEGEKVWRGKLKRGQRKSLEFSLSAKAEVQASVRVDVEATPYGRSDRSSYYMEVSTLSRPLTVDEEKNEILVPSLEVSPRAATPITPQAGNITVAGRFVYVNEYGVQVPMRDVEVELMDDDYGVDERVDGKWTDDSGYVSFTVGNDEGWGYGTRDPYLKVSSQNHAADGVGSVLLGTNYTIETNHKQDVNDGLHDFGTIQSSAANDVFQAIDAVLTARRWVWNQGTGYQRTQVNVAWPEGDWPKFVGPLVDAIQLPSKQARGWNHVTLHHEYGHAIMWDIYGLSYPFGALTGPDPHYIFSQSNTGFAMSEGWAEYMSAAVDGNRYNVQGGAGVGGDIESNAWYDHADSGDMDGEIIEGSVASILWDMTDPASAADRDAMAIGFGGVFSLLNNDEPDSMGEYWTYYTSKYPDVASSVGPLSSIYWHYGIDKDTYPPFGVGASPLTLSSDSGVPGWTKTTKVTATLSFDDHGSGVRSMRMWNSGETPPAFVPFASPTLRDLSPGDGLKGVNAQVRDAKGLESGSYLATIRLDTTPPSGGITIEGGAATTGDAAVTLTLSAGDGQGCGVSGMQVSNDGTFDNEPWEDYKASKQWTLSAGVGQKRVYVRYRDKLGNSSGGYSDDIQLTGPVADDKTAPVTTSDAKATYSGSATIHLSATDAGSGVAKTFYKLDDGAQTEGTAITTSVKGGHKLEFWSVDNAGNEEEHHVVDFLVDGGVPPSGTVLTPVEGATRIDTAVQASKQGFPSGADTVLIATAFNFPDALGGSSLAGALNAPLLLTSTDSLPYQVEAEIRRLGAKRVVVLGSGAAVSAQVGTKLASLVGGWSNFKRIGGVDRYETAALIAEETVKTIGASAFDGSVFIATGENFPDALAASPLAASKKRPILLARKDGLPGATSNMLTALSVKKATLLGSANALSGTVGQAVMGKGIAIDRLQGPTRYQTAIEIAKQGVSEGLKWDGLALATGANYPDALSGGVMCCTHGSVMLLTEPTALTQDVRAVLTANKASIREVHVLGSTAAVSQACRNGVMDALK